MPHRRVLAPALLLLVLGSGVAACAPDASPTPGRDDGLGILWVDAAGGARLDTTRGTDQVRIDLPGGDPTWVSFGADEAIALTRADALVALRSATNPDWHDLTATDASGHPPPTPSWFTMWGPDGGRLAMLAGDLAARDAVSVVFADPSTTSAFTIPIDATVLPAPPAWLDDDRVVIVVTDGDRVETRIVDATDGSITAGPGGSRFVAISTDGSTVATLADGARAIELFDASSWLGPDRSPFARIPEPTDGATPIAFALDGDGGRIAVAWRSTDGAVRVAVHVRAQDWLPDRPRTFDDRARGAVVGWWR